MRSLLAVAALALIVAPGCGDDTSNAADMTAPVADLSVAHDMAQITTCAGVLQCAQNCGMNTSCQQDCVNRGSTQAVATLLALQTCLLDQCGSMDGGAPQCTGATDTSTTCQQCIKAAGQAAAGGGPCAQELATCFSS